MPVTPETVFDLSVKHRIALSRFSTHLVQKVIAQLNRVEQSAVAKLAEAASDSLTAIRLEQLLTQIRSIQSAGWVLIGERVNGGLQRLADSEAAFAARLIGVGQETVFTGAPAFAQVYAAVQARPFQGKLLREWLKDAEEGAAKRVRETIRQGFIDGTPTDQIVRQLRGTKAAGYQDGILQGTRRGVEAMVRTAVTHTANVAHDQVFKANADIVNALRWTSVLDGRTTLICISRSGHEYPVDSGPRPPAHIGCRSVMVPVVDDIPGVAPFTPPTYEAWLKKQPAAFQDEVLGASRGALFRRGGLSVDRFVDRAGNTLSLDQLRARDSSAFKAAGL
ncbi:MAG: minor capsid protein [Alphaproteobacteria bacterium]